MIRWSMRRLPDGHYEGAVSFTPAATVTYPGARGALRKGKRVTLKAQGSSPGTALAKAASVADKILDNPVLRSALPPGSSTAIKAVKYLSKSAAAGKLKSAAKKVVGKGAKRLFKTLSSWF